jgi:hypothetical protein
MKRPRLDNGDSLPGSVMYPNPGLVRANCGAYKRPERIIYRQPRTSSVIGSPPPPRSNMRFTSAPLCALVLASLVVALPQGVRSSLLPLLPDLLTLFLVGP